MPQQTAVTELAELRAQLETPAAVASSPVAAAVPSPTVDRSESQLQIERLLQELHSALNDATENAEGLIAEHPLGSVSAAFLLGLAVGWLAARG